MGSSPHTHARDGRTDGQHRFGVRAIGATFHLKAIHHNVCTVLYTVCTMLHGHCPHSPRLVGLENWSSARALGLDKLSDLPANVRLRSFIFFARSAPTQPT